MNLFKLLSIALIFVGIQAVGAPGQTMIRWTGSEDSDASLQHVLDVLKAKTGQVFTSSDFVLIDDRDLAYTHYQLYEQVVSNVPLDGSNLRVWTDRNTKNAVQVEASLTLSAESRDLKRLVHFSLTPEDTDQLSRDAIKNSEDPFTRGLDWKDKFQNGKLVRVVTIKGKRGKHVITISHRSRSVIANEYREFPQDDEIALQAMVYPIYEEVEGGDGTILPRTPAVLKHILPQVPQVSGDIYAPLKTQRYWGSTFSPILGLTAEGREKGYWSMAYVKEQAAKIRSELPLLPNDVSHGLLLQGKYATINIHPDAITHFTGINFTPAPSSAFFPMWVESDPVEMIPGNAFSGKPLLSDIEVMNRPARRLPNHDPVSYMNDGFDEIQVYYAINTLMESLQDNGFKDPDLSTRPFNAFLFNPDIAYRDNAFYTDDTINFTTYSANQSNAARDNSTIWHELGHGIMDRLMGDSIVLADTGGLSEGMADFVAAMIIQSVTQGKPFPGSTQFRIINKTGFNLTNEVHDDGESYGGAMKDFMDAVVLADPANGLHKVIDVVLEAMRLTRDHPGLTAQDWFNHILFADSLGRPDVRAPGELKKYLMAALNGRNFSLEGAETAYFKLMNESSGQEVVAGKEGSRSRPILLELPKDGKTSFDLSVKLSSSGTYAFTYPVKVKVQFDKGALEGAAHWVGEENGDIDLTLNSEADMVHIPLTVTGTCDSINREDGSCVDYVYVKIFSQGQDVLSAKKRFYVRVKNPVSSGGILTATRH